MHRHTKNIVTAGTPLAEAQKAMIMVHGRGDSARGILSLAEVLRTENFALLAPEATGNTWYPFSFMAPAPQNEPGLSTALEVLDQLVDDVLAGGLAKEDLYFLGFSQGACLTSEFLARRADRYGGAFLYSGGLIGAAIDRSNYRGDFRGTPMLLGCSDVDPHIPLKRVQETSVILSEMGAEVDERIYPHAPHTVLEDEIEQTNRMLISARS